MFAFFEVAFTLFPGTYDIYHRRLIQFVDNFAPREKENDWGREVETERVEE